jgi:hypothetical protein
MEEQRDTYEELSAKNDRMWAKLREAEADAETAGRAADDANERNKMLCEALRAVVTARGIRGARAIARKALREHDETVKLERE